MTAVKVLKSASAQERGRAEHCHRCGGILIQERVFEIGSFDWRCVSCGDRIDPVILAHRQAQGANDLARQEAERLLTGKGKARLN